jgi:hypothetical protein
MKKIISSLIFGTLIACAGYTSEAEEVDVSKDTTTTTEAVGGASSSCDLAIESRTVYAVAIDSTTSEHLYSTTATDVDLSDVTLCLGNYQYILEEVTDFHIFIIANASGELQKMKWSQQDHQYRVIDSDIQETDLPYTTYDDYQNSNGINELNGADQYFFQYRKNARHYRMIQI